MTEAGPPAAGGNPATSVASAARASGRASGANVAAPTLAAAAASSMVCGRSTRWVKNPLLRSVICTPARISTRASSMAALAGGSLMAPAYMPAKPGVFSSTTLLAHKVLACGTGPAASTASS